MIDPDELVELYDVVNTLVLLGDADTAIRTVIDVTKCYDLDSDDIFDIASKVFFNDSEPESQDRKVYMIFVFTAIQRSDSKIVGIYVMNAFEDIYKDLDGDAKLDEDDQESVEGWMEESSDAGDYDTWAWAWFAKHDSGPLGQRARRAVMRWSLAAEAHRKERGKDPW